MLTPGGVLLYLDEIQYFNKKQQQSLLEFMEDGRITVIASTTENPYFYVYNAVLSRSTVFEFKKVPAAEVEKAVLRAVSILCARENVTADIEPGTVGISPLSAAAMCARRSTQLNCSFLQRRVTVRLFSSCARMPKISRSAAPCTTTARVMITLTLCLRL